MSQQILDEKSIFNIARRIDVCDARLEYLDQVCGSDPEVRSRIVALLDIYEREQTFLESPLNAANVAVELLAPVCLGMNVGPYKLIEEIGQGGMGVVYMAEQKEPVRRLVALKIVKPGMDSRQVIARFEAERQALAMMEHPNIARIIDAGTTEQGRPYFVMELVRGIPINEFCDQKCLTLRERLDLFLQVCQAVQHAHQKGIIHRDLKPTNVLVTLLDVVAVPKVIDFGIAKAFGPQLTDHTQVTAFAQFVGTPLYMSPEQAEMNQLGVDTRSDVYSLGVMLYELLTGTTPFDKEMLKRANIEELKRKLREEDPPRPSARISTLDARALSTVSEHRGTEPRKIATDIRGELDWIVMKALEKDRTRRYESAIALAADVQCYLNDETVQACPPSKAYRFGKFARRNKTAIATTTLIAALLIIGIGVSTWQAVRATLAEAKADFQLNLARKSDLEAKRQASEAVRQRESLRRYLYASDIKLAWSLFQNASHGSDLDQVHELLSRHEPSANQEDLRSFAWYYMNRLCSKTVSSTLYGHEGKVYHVAISPDAKTIASAGQDGTAKLCDLGTKQVRHTLRGHVGDVNCSAFSPDGKTLATASDDMTVKFWDVDSGQERFTPTLIGLNLPVHRVEWSSDGKLLLTSELSEKRDSGKITIWNLPSGLKQREFVGHFALALSPDGRTLATTNWDKVVRMWDIASGQERTVLQGHANIVLTGMFSSDGKLFATGSDDQTVKIWNLVEGLEETSLIRSWRNASYSVHSVSWTPDHQLLAIAYEDGETHLREPKSRFLRGVLKSGARVRAVRFTQDGRNLVSAGDDGTVRLVDCSAAQTETSLPCQPGIITSIGFSTDSELLATTNDKNEGRLWRVASGDSMAFPPNQSDQGVCCMAFSPIGRTLAIGRTDGTASLVDAITGERRVDISWPQAMLRSLIFSPDGEMLAGSFEGGSICVWDTQIGKELHSMNTGHDYVQHGIAFSPDGKTLALQYADIVSRLDLTKWQLRAKETRQSRELNCVAYAPDGKFLAIGTAKQIEFWDTATDQQTAILPSHGGDIRSFAFAPDGRTMASANNIGELKLWDVATKQEMFSVVGHTGSVHCMAFSPNGKTLATASVKPDGRGEVRFWHSALGTPEN